MVKHRGLWRICVVVLLCGLGDGLTAQTPSGPSFDVVSIKPTRSDSGGQVGTPPGGRWQMVNMPIQSLILSAYQTKTFELVGAPPWVSNERYDVVAKANAEPTPQEFQGMLRSLLVERFNFRGHYETLDRDVYALVLANKDGKLGSELRRSAIDCAAFFAAKPVQGLPRAVASNGVPACFYSNSGTRIVSGGATMESLAASMSGPGIGRIVIDKTGLPGYYEFTLRFTPPGAASPTDNAPSIFTALQEQLGLKLEPQRVPMELLVVDHIDRPSPD